MNSQGLIDKKANLESEVKKGHASLKQLDENIAQAQRAKQQVIQNIIFNNGRIMQLNDIIEIESKATKKEK